jgi:hypothetical protein
VETRILLHTRTLQPLGRASITAFDGDLGLGSWRATLGRLEHAGRIATAFFQDGVRQISIELPDGRVLDATLRGTSVAHGAERICEVAAP